MDKLKVKIWLGFRGKKVEEVDPIEMYLPYNKKKKCWYFDRNPTFVFKDRIELSIDSCIYEIWERATIVNWMDRSQREIYKYLFFEDDTLTINNSKTCFC
jgi:hypothetical protein